MTKPSACAGPSRRRPAVLSSFTAAAIVGLIPPCQADPTNLTTPQAPAFPSFLDDRRLQAIEQLAKPRFEALALRRAEKLKRRAIESDLKRKAEDMRRAVDAAGDVPRESLVNLIAPAQANASPVLPPAASAAPPPDRAPAAPIRATTGMTLPFLTLPAKPKAPTDCRNGFVTTSPLPGGRVAIDISEPCRKGELVTVRYTPYVFMRPLDAEGRLRFVLDLFQGREPAVSVVFASGETRPVPIGATDIDRVSKVAVIWGKAVNLDLHVFEYAAASGSAGHIWTKSPSHAEAARDASSRTQRGRGFLSSASDGTEPGHQVEVYTLWHHSGQASGVVSTALDYETRAAATAGPTCGDGDLAEIPFETITFAPRRPPVRERGLIPRAACGAALIEKARFQDDAVADLPLTLD